MNTTALINASAMLVALLVTLPLPSLTAQTLVKENFDSLPVGHVASGRYPHIIPWEGPSEREFGRIEITDQFPGSESTATGKDRLNVIAIHDNSPALNKSSSLVFPWKDKAPTSGRLTLSWEFLVPVEPPFLGIHFLGGSWDSSAAAVLLADGKIILHANKGDTTRLTVGAYQPGKWHALKAELDITARTLDLWLDGKKVANAVPWLASAPKSIDRLSTVADFAPVDRHGAAILFLDNIDVTAVP